MRPAARLRLSGARDRRDAGAGEVFGDEVAHHVGGDKLPELQRQSAAYAAALGDHGLPAALETVPGRNHFTVVDELAAADGVLLRGLLRLAGQLSTNKAV